MKDILIKSYNRDAKNYDSKFKQLQNIKYQNLFDTSFLPSTNFICKIADFGCGTALFKEYLDSQNLYIDYHGFDISEQMVRIAMTRSNNILVADINKSPYKDKEIHCVTCFTVLRIIKDNELNMLNEMYRVLMDDGTLFLSVLEKNVNRSLYDNFELIGFKVVKEVSCGQDRGFICKKGEIR